MNKLVIDKCKCGRSLKTFESCTPFGCQQTFLCEKCFLSSENCRCEYYQ